VNVLEAVVVLTCSWWSKVAITFDRGNHPNHVPYPGRFPLIVSPIINKVHLTKVLMDGNNTLNILYAYTLDKIKIPGNNPHPSGAPMLYWRTFIFRR
jgi:hypothetical protein